MKKRDDYLARRNIIVSCFIRAARENKRAKEPEGPDAKCVRHVVMCSAEHGKWNCRGAQDEQNAERGKGRMAMICGVVRPAL